MNIKTVAVTAISLAGIAFAGTTAYSSKVANRVLDEMAAESAAGQRIIQLQQLERDSGFIRSSGLFSVALDASCIGSEASLPQVPAQIRYSIGHMPDLTRVSSYTATIELTGEAGDAFSSAAGQRALLVIEGAMGFDGQWTHKTRSPKIRVDQDGLQIAVSASDGEITGLGSAGSIGFAWSMPSIKMEQDGNGVELTGLSAAGVIEDRQLGLGKQTIGIERIDISGDLPGGTALMSGLRFDYETLAADGRVSSSFQPSVDLVRVVGNTFQDLLFKVQLSGIDERSLREIDQATHNQCQTQLDEEQLAQIERAILRIIDKGVSFSITDLKGRQLENSFGGELMFTLEDRGDGSKGPVMAMRDRLTASGELTVSQQLVPAHLRDSLVEQAFVQLNGAMMEANMTFAEGDLRINGARDGHGFADSIDVFLDLAEQGMADWHDQIAAGNGPLVTLARAAREP